MAPTARRRADIILVAVLLLVALIWFAASQMADESGSVVVCQTKDGFWRVDPLSADITYTVDTPGTGFGADADGGVNMVRIADGTVEVTEANCGNQVCVEHAPISQTGEQIVCLPHGLVVQIARDAEDVSPLM